MAIFQDMFFLGKIISRVQHINEVAADKGRGTVTANEIDFDESMIDRAMPSSPA